MKIELEEIELGPVLGIGTVGTVHLGTFIKSGESVAVKFLQEAISEDDLITQRFRREVAILERLRHPNIIKYLGDGKHEGRLFYVMEALESGTLKGLLERFGALSWQEVASIARQVCSALQYAHNHGIVHRDIKPGNLFLTPTGQIKLGDFGIARDSESADLTSKGLTVGTHAYMAPEQITAERPTTGKADLYALGCVLFELLAGQKPFQGQNFAVLFEQHLNQKPPMITEFVPECPRPLEDCIAQLLAKSPDDRPFNARAVQGVMLGLLEETQPKAEQTGDGKPSVTDVGAGSVVDSGMVSLARKLGPMEERKISWLSLVIILAAGVLIVTLLAATR